MFASRKVILILTLVLASFYIFSAPASAEKTKLFVEDVLGRPDPDDGPTKISVVMWVIDIDHIDSAAQSFMANLYVEFRWKDPRLAHGGKGIKRYRKVDVWTPQIIIANETGIVRKTLPEKVDVFGDGTVRYRQRYVGPFSQPLDLRDFPFDSQIFRIHFVAVRGGLDDIEFVASERLVKAGMPYAAGIAENISLPDWHITSHQAREWPYMVMEDMGSPGYVFEFVAKRDINYYILKVLMPLLMIVLMSGAVFWISPARFAIQMTIAVTSMLTLIAYRFSVDTLIPRVSYITKLDSFMLFSTFLIFLSIIIVTLISIISVNHREFAMKLNKSGRVFFPAVFFIMSYLIMKINFYG